MNAPAPANILETPDLRIVKRTDCRPSPTNPRVRSGFDAASLTELAQSMAPPVGIIEPLVGRELPDGILEIVCGERRWRAAEIAKLDSIPILVRTLTDVEVLHIQLIENVNREDLDALEEAEGYEKLMKEIDPSTGKTYTADKLAEIGGVSRSTIFQRRKLLALCEDARKAYYDGKIDASTALLIARISPEKIQLEALKDVLKQDMSYRQTQDHIQRHYMLGLKTAVFDIKDAALLKKAGACDGCPKRTGNQPDLFSDVKSKDVCTDSVCFAMKKAAHVLKLQKEAENTGAEFIGAKKAKKLIGNQYSDAATQLRDHGYAPLDTLVPGDAKKRTLGQLLEENNLMKPTLVSGKPVVQKTIVANPHRDGQMIETVNIEAATKALREAGFEITLKGKDTSAQSQQDQAKQREKDKQELIVENTFRARLFDTLHAKFEADMLDPNSGTFPILYHHLAATLFDEYADFILSHEDVVAFMRRYADIPEQKEGEEIDWPSVIAEFQDNLPNLTPAKHLLMIIELPLIAGEITAEHNSASPSKMLILADELGIDADGMRKAVAKELKPAAKNPAKAKPAPSDKKPSAKAKPAKAGSSLKDLLEAPKPAETKAAAPVAKVAVSTSTWPFPEPGTPRPAATPAAQAQDSGAKTKATPAKPVPAKAGTKRKAAAAA